MAAAHHRAREPAHARAHHIGADHRQQGRGQPPQPRIRVLAAAVRASPHGTSRQPRPALSAPLASHRSCQLSPGWSSSQSSSRRQPEHALLLRAGAVRCERRAGQPPECLFAVCRGRGPAGGHRARGKPGTHAREGKRSRGTRRILLLDDGVMTPRSRTGRPASRAGSRVPGAGRARPAACRVCSA